MARNERKKKLTAQFVGQQKRQAAVALDAATNGLTSLGIAIGTCDTELIGQSCDDLLVQLAEATRLVRRLQKTVACGEFDCCCHCRWLQGIARIPGVVVETKADRAAAWVG